MFDYIKCVVPARKKQDKKVERMYTWVSHLHDFEKGKAQFVSVEAFNQNLLADFREIVKEGVILEIVLHDYDKVTDGVEIRWFARIEKLCGYRAQVQYVGSRTSFWIHILSGDVHAVANFSGATVDPSQTLIIYVPPLAQNLLFADDMENFINNAIENEVVGQQCIGPQFEEKRSILHKPRFRVGQRLELLNYQKSTEIRVARIREVCGRRMNVLVMKNDCPFDEDEDYPTMEEDRQIENKGAQYWIDEASFFIFPVGFAAFNRLTLRAMPDYIEHTKKIAEAMENDESPKYDPDDVTFDDLKKEPVSIEHLKPGQKFELIDPLAQQFNSLHVATIIKFCKSNGYMIIGMDGPDMEEDSFPIHINNTFMYPCGYSEKYGLKLEKIDGFRGTFRWNEYLEKEGAEALPMDTIRPEVPQERLDMFHPGMRLEAADMCENQFICPATIKSVHGRVINVNFDGWNEEFDELYDIDSHDILPIGWCEFHSYVLQQPKQYN